MIITSCSPQNYPIKDKVPTTKKTNIISNEKVQQKANETNVAVEKKINKNNPISNEIEILLPKNENKRIAKNFINAFELSLYKKNISNIKLSLNNYEDHKDILKIVSKKASPGKIFIGPLTSSDTEIVQKECHKGIIFFSFAADRKQAGDCIFLINFFPEDDLIALFKYFKTNSKIAMLYPENDYGYYINSIIDPIATKSNALIINRASYKEDLSNAREAIKELSKYELRKYELDRQKTILKAKNDEASRRALKKIERFETAGVVDFTHIIIPDYSIRLLQIAPLLPFYDIDPNTVQFVGTGVWDNEAFFDEPSLQGAIFPGISEENRRIYLDEYYYYYEDTPIRTITIPYDLIGIIDYLVTNKFNTEDISTLLNDKQLTFEGIDGKFSFKKNIISRELNILKISNGNTILVN